MLKNLFTAIKGFFMGAANVVPGVSGGTVALITGIFEELVDALNSILDIRNWRLLLKAEFREFWTRIHGTFLLSLGIGIIVSVFSLAKLCEYCLRVHPVQTWAFFFGLILLSAYVMMKDVKGWKAKDLVAVVAGVLLGLVVCTLSPTETPDSLWFIFICGAVSICTMILPGISGSFILVVLSKYDYIMSAVSNLDLPVLAIFAAGCLVGILAFSKFLHWLLSRYERATMLVLVGFVLGSLVKVWPWNDMEAVPDGGLHIAGAVIWCVAGMILIAATELMRRKKNCKE